MRRRSIAHGIRAWQSLQAVQAAPQSAGQLAVTSHAARAISGTASSLYDGRSRGGGPDYSMEAKTPTNYGIR
jgi:hypothetical protein